MRLPLSINQRDVDSKSNPDRPLRMPTGNVRHAFELAQGVDVDGHPGIQSENDIIDPFDRPVVDDLRRGAADLEGQVQLQTRHHLGVPSQIPDQPAKVGDIVRFVRIANDDPGITLHERGTEVLKIADKSLSVKNVKRRAVLLLDLREFLVGTQCAILQTA